MENSVGSIFDVYQNYFNEKLKLEFGKSCKLLINYFDYDKKELTVMFKYAGHNSKIVFKKQDNDYYVISSNCIWDNMVLNCIYDDLVDFYSIIYHESKNKLRRSIKND